MRNKKLIPFEIIEKAVAGDPEAIDLSVLQSAQDYQIPGHIKDIRCLSISCESDNYALYELWNFSTDNYFLYFRFLSLPFRQLMGRGNIKRRKGMEWVID